MKKVLRSIFYLFFPLLVGSIVGILISNFIDYSALNLPPLSPPAIVFPIVWTILYLLMGVSYDLFKKKESSFSGTSILYYFQLFVNALWSIFFFVLKWRGFTIFWTVLLLISVILTYMALYYKNKPSAYLFIPYILWCAFAFYLTLGVYILN